MPNVSSLCSRIRLCTQNLHCRAAGPAETLSQARGRAKPGGKGTPITATVDDDDVLEVRVHQGSSYQRKSALYALLKKCIANKDLVLGSRVHALVIRNGYESDAFLANHIICMYAAHQRLEEAMQVFTTVPTPCRYMWASIIFAHVRQGHPLQAIGLYQQLRQSALKPDNRIFLAVLKACAAANDLSSGRAIHCDILGSGGEPDIFVHNCLVHMYAKCGSLGDACEVFETLPAKDIVTWTAMIAAYAQHGLGHQALALYHRMMTQQGVAEPDEATFVCLLQACSSVAALEMGKYIHHRISVSGLLQHAQVTVANVLIDMYCKCGCLDDAKQVFHGSCNRNDVTWTTLLSGYAHHGRAQECLALYALMQQQGVTPVNHVTFVCLLQACAAGKLLDKGKEIHSQIQEQGYAQHGFGQEALALHGAMPAELAATGDASTFVSVLQACGSVAALEKGKQIHAQVLATVGLVDTDITVANALIDMYFKCRSSNAARALFDMMPVKDVVTWNVMINGYVQQGLGQYAFALYNDMQEEGTSTQPNHVTFVCLLRACASGGALHQGLHLHSQIQSRGLETDVPIGTCLVDMYAKCGSLGVARRVFDSLPRKHVVTWNAMIAGYAHHGLGHEALSIYESMLQEGLTPADAVTFTCLLQACSCVAGLEKGREIHAHIMHDGHVASDLSVGNALIHMYGKCGSVVDAQQVFDEMPRRDVVSWSSLIAGYARQGETKLVFRWFETMRQVGVQPDGVAFLSVLSACSHAGDVDRGQHYFDMMTTDYAIRPTAEHCNSFVDLLGRAGQVERAMHIAKSMPPETQRDVWRSLLGSCQKWKNVELGRQAFDSAVLVDSTDPAAYVLMSNIYAAANMQEAAGEIKAMRLKAQAWKNPGRTWCTDRGGIVRTFLAGDAEQLDNALVTVTLEHCRLKLQELG